MSAPLKVGSDVPIGSPVSGAALFVLDQWLRTVPVGVVEMLTVQSLSTYGAQLKLALV